MSKNEIYFNFKRLNYKNSTFLVNLNNVVKSRIKIRINIGKSYAIPVKYISRHKFLAIKWLALLVVKRLKSMYNQSLIYGPSL